MTTSEHPCDTFKCDQPAAWALNEGDGNYCLYVCDYHVEVAFPDGVGDGIPGEVERL